jgi:hypothetical protein
MNVVDPTNQNCSCKYGSITRDRLLLDVINKSSLDLYQYLYIKQGKQVYLDKWWSNDIILEDGWLLHVCEWQ